MTEHSPKFYTVKRYYLMGFWSKLWVYNAVEKQWITEEEYEEIVGTPYLEG